MPYQMGAKTHCYYPDFILKIDIGEETPLNLVVEVKGYRKEYAKVKSSTMNALWVPGMNQLGTFGRWAFAEFTDVWEFEKNMDKLIEGVN